MNKINRYKKWFETGACLFMLLFILTMSGKAQKGPSILKIFDKYGNKQGVMLLEITDDLMKEYQVDVFKSIIFKDGSEVLPEIRKLIDIDKQNAKKIKESKQDGLLISGYYRLKTENDSINQYLIFKIGKNNKVTLVYIKGKITPEQLVELLR